MRPALVWLLMLAVLYRGAIPLGYMPTVNAENGITMMICTSDGAKWITTDNTGKPLEQKTDKDTEHSAHKPCPFALTVTPFAADFSAATVLLTQIPTRVDFARRIHHPALAALYPTAPPRAPPLYS